MAGTVSVLLLVAGLVAFVLAGFLVHAALGFTAAGGALLVGSWMVGVNEDA